MHILHISHVPYLIIYFITPQHHYSAQKVHCIYLIHIISFPTDDNRRLLQPVVGDLQTSTCLYMSMTYASLVMKLHNDFWTQYFRARQPISQYTTSTDRRFSISDSVAPWTRFQQGIDLKLTQSKARNTNWHIELTYIHKIHTASDAEPCSTFPHMDLQLSQSVEVHQRAMTRSSHTSQTARTNLLWALQRFFQQHESSLDWIPTGIPTRSVFKIFNQSKCNTDHFIARYYLF